MSAVLVTQHLGRMIIAAGICPKAPPGLQPIADGFEGNAKWFALASMGVAFFVGVGLVVWGRLWHHPKGAKLGVEILLACLAAAVLYVVGYTWITSITGNGC